MTVTTSLSSPTPYVDGFLSLPDSHSQPTLVSILVDTGADYSLVKESVCTDIFLKQLEPTDVSIVGANGEPLPVLGRVVSSVSFLSASSERSFEHPLLVVTHLPMDMLLGWDFLRQYDGSISLRKAALFVNSCRVPLVIDSDTDDSGSVSTVHAMSRDEDVNGESLFYGSAGFISTGVVSPCHPNEFRSLAAQMKIPANLQDDVRVHAIFDDSGCEAFRVTAIGGPKTTHLVRHEIHTEGPPISEKPFRMSAQKREALETMVRDKLAAGVIRPSSSPWSANAFAVPKPSGKGLRMVVNYVKLNSVTAREYFPSCNFEDCVDSLDGSTVFSSLDLMAGFYGLPLDEESKTKTAFTTHSGQYEYNVLPMGLSNSPSSFQRMMTLAFEGIIWKYVLVYIDDLLVFSPSVDAHIEHLQEVFRRINAANLTFKASKSELFQSSVLFLGHRFSADGIAKNPEKTNALLAMPPPTSKKELRSILGGFGYWSRFIPQYANIVQPLYELTTKNCSFAWNATHEDAFATVKRLLTSAPILRFPNLSRPFEIHTDASAVGIGAVLIQTDSEGQRWPLHYISRVLKANERKWHVQEWEALAVVWAVEKFRVYLEDRPFTIYTDHRNLRSMLSLGSSARLARWALALSEYEFEVVYLKGSDNAVPDMLSRFPVSPAQSSGTIAVVDDSRAPVSNNFTLSQFRLAQQADRWCKNVSVAVQRHRQNMSSGGVVSKSWVRCALVDDILYYNGRLVVPVTLRYGLLSLWHRAEWGIHKGSNTLYRALQLRYWWPGMTVDVRRFVSACTTCQSGQVLPQHITDQGLYSSLEVFKPGDTLVLDFFGPLLPVTANGNQYVLVIVDAFTRWVELFPSSTATAATVSSKLFEVFARFGCPSRLLSDRGSHFRNELIGNISQRCGVRQLFTLPYHHEAAGLVERVMRSLKNGLRSLVRDRRSDWDVFLPGIAMALRMTPHSSTGDTPFFLQYGRDPRWPSDVILPTPETQDVSISSADGFVRHLNQVLNASHEASIGLLRYQHVRSLMNEHRDSCTFNISDLVFVYRPDAVDTHIPGQPKKLRSRWSGPFRVLSPLNVPGGYTVRHLYTGRTKDVHVSQMRKFRPLQLFEDSHLDPAEYVFDSSNFHSEEVIAEAEEQYDVHSIVDHAAIGKGRQRRWKFLVHWDGFDSSEDSWVSDSNLREHCHTLVDHYLEANGLHRRPYGRIRRIPRVPVFADLLQ